MPVRIAIAEDKFFLAQSLKEKLSFFKDFDLRITAENGQVLIEKIREQPQIDLILMDIEMPVLNGIAATAIIKDELPHVKIIMLTVFDDDLNIFNAIQAGADGYLLKETPPDTLKTGIEETLAGGAAMTPAIAMRTLKLLRNPEAVTHLETQEEIQLSQREVEVLEQLEKGLSYTKIAENLVVSPSTVRKHIENIYKKLQVHNKLEAVKKARKNNLI
ncbi:MULTISPECIES: response regulator transcription factor [unclassified Leeuwenhoekiella]|uniref:response regulator transcription factor n=1 Tax=unclassified Leeuwenhoekiella TaxID=2615029 RepID=UPI000C51B911|nr:MULTISPECIES: response regulator transcription factor [unclassified Leeuwenhoekiella]MBA80440.1 DNA-binding response regulator [Leeuwenhoekiella sp.]|tara:strand:- start:27161 stop:27811 length:651 start_codon:yes stop_codon:yes gene_type:complete